MSTLTSHRRRILRNQGRMLYVIGHSRGPLGIKIPITRQLRSWAIVVLHDTYPDGETRFVLDHGQEKQGTKPGQRHATRLAKRGGAR